MSTLLIIIYLLSSVTFVLGLKMLSHPRTARKGNLIAATGMTVAIAATIFLYESNGKFLGNYTWIFGALILGTIVGWLSAKKVKMTAMPEMVSMFNGMGGACAGLISVSEYMHIKDHIQDVNLGFLVAIIIGLIIGFISFAGSIVAWAKLNGSFGNIRFPGQKIINNLLLLGVLVLAVYFLSDIYNPDSEMLFYSIVALSLLYGLFFVFPIGGADMPVVISLLNSFTGMAAACGGFLYYNWAMLTGGILVGSAGTILTILMCKAMNRSLLNVLFSSMGSGSSSGNKVQGEVKALGVSDVAALMRYANQVMIVPGYGLAVAQAQHVCHELEKFLETNDVQVKYAIHPVAGRMPGHMNVLLAEANVNYDKLLEMEQANEEFKQTDVVLILGANDVVNPAAKNDKSSPIYGMPILEVLQAKNVIVNKRSMKPGYAGIDNELFYDPKTSMYFGDAKQALQQLLNEIKNM